MKNKKSIQFISIVSILVFLSLNSNAQETENQLKLEVPKSVQEFDVDTNSSKKIIERVEVLGSRIKKIENEKSTSTVSINKTTIQNSANTSAADALRDSSISIEGVQQYGNYGPAVIGLRGLGAERTLVLLNGYRLPVDPALNAVDLNIVPASSIEKIEILKEGASALYGSDAIGGTINIVTKKLANTSVFDAKYSGTELPGGSTYTIGAATGVNNESNNALISIAIKRQDKILGRNREITKNGFSTFSPAAVWKGTGQPGYTLAQPSECPADLLRSSGGNQTCRYRYYDNATTKPEIDQYSLLLDYSYRFSSNFKLYTQNIGSYRNTFWIAPPQGREITGLTGTASNLNATSVKFRTADAGNQDSKDFDIIYSSTLGIKGQINTDLDYDFFANLGEVHQNFRGINGYINPNKLKTLVQNGSYDPLAPEGQRGDISTAAQQYNQFRKQRIFSTEANISGDLLDLENGSLGFAAGLSFRSDKQLLQTDDIGFGTSNRSGERNLYSFFTEVNYPITKKIEINAALRFDRYSDFGATVNPKISTKYIINETLLVRGSYGTGFKAPLFLTMNRSPYSGIEDFVDRKLCAQDPSQCSSQSWNVKFVGNKDLKEEKSQSISLGTVYQPSEKFTISVDTWYTKIKNIIGFNFEAMTQAEQNGVNPSDYGVTVDRDSSGKIILISFSDLNLSANEVSGIDIVTAAELAKFENYVLIYDNNFAYKFMDRIEGFPGAGSSNSMGQWGKPYWKNNAKLTFKKDINSLAVTLRSIPGQNVQNSDVDRKISDLNEWDLEYNHKFSKKIEFTLGAKNIMNAAQPVDIGAGIFAESNEVNQELYDIDGTRYFINFSQKF